MADYGPAAEVDSEGVRRHLGDRLRLRRDEIGLNQTDVGFIAGVSRTTMRAVETGRPVEGRTLSNVKRALGCAPGSHYRNRYDSINGIETPRPVLSVGATRILTAAILRRGEDGTEALTADYFDLVNALSEIPPTLPETLSRLWDALHRLLSPSDMSFIEREITDTIDPATPSGRMPIMSIVDKSEPALYLSRAHDPLPNALVGAVVQSGLPDDIQRMIREFLGRRQADLRAKLNVQLESEAGYMVATAHSAFTAVAKSLGEDVDSPRVRQVVESLLNESIRMVLLGVAGAPGATPPPPNDQPR